VKFQVKRQCLSTHHISHNQRGFTLFEIFLALLILAIAIVPMMNAFAPALLSTSQGEEQAVLTGQARQTMNWMLDLDFRTLDTNQATPDVLVALFVSQAGVDYVPAVAITDASGGSGGLLEVKVTRKNVTLQTLKANR
jgi:prepilin-type N-terminal cleavage/methylation domain-containing protein